MNENKCPDHPEKISRYCLECVKRISAEVKTETAKEISAMFDKAVWEDMEFSEPDNSDVGEHFDLWYRKDDVDKTIHALKKKYKVD